MGISRLFLHRNSLFQPFFRCSQVHPIWPCLDSIDRRYCFRWHDWDYYSDKHFKWRCGFLRWWIRHLSYIYCVQSSNSDCPNCVNNLGSSLWNSYGDICWCRWLDWHKLVWYKDLLYWGNWWWCHFLAEHCIGHKDDNCITRGISKSVVVHYGCESCIRWLSIRYYSNYSDLYSDSHR